FRRDLFAAMFKSGSLSLSNPQEGTLAKIDLANADLSKLDFEVECDLVLLDSKTANPASDDQITWLDGYDESPSSDSIREIMVMIQSTMC
ncbi:hypothetical protein FO526_35130, partial [Bacillus thuringiensis]|uniref:hypothetical protein n=1 Tax=Bacillus thuringiensis TaxID=1428 RepID=UPI00284542C3